MAFKIKIKIRFVRLKPSSQSHSFSKRKVRFSVLQIGLYDKSFVDIQRDKIKVFTTFLVKKSLSKKQKKNTKKF